MSDASYHSDTDDSVGQESYVSSPLHGSSQLSDTSLLYLAGLATPDLEPAPLDAFPLMKLSPELRLKVYEQLLIDLTVKRQRAVADLNKYHRAHEWPTNDFSAYLNLLLTCKEIHWHVKGLWENVYIHKCCFYFWKLPDFHRVSTSLVKLGEPYRRARYALRTRASDEIGLDEAEFLELQGEEFMSTQPGFPIDKPDYAEFQWCWPKFPYAGRSGAHTLDGNGPIPVETYRQGPKHKKFGRASFPGLMGCSLTVHERHVSQRHCGTAYMLMVGEVDNVHWAEYDVAFGKSKQLIWNEWEKRGFPESSLARANIVLAQRTQLETGMAAMWLRKGDEPSDHEEALLKIEEVYSLSNWLRMRPMFSVG